MCDDVGATVRIAATGVTRLRFDLAKCFAALTLMTVRISHVLRRALQDPKLRVDRLRDLRHGGAVVSPVISAGQDLKDCN